MTKTYSSNNRAIIGNKPHLLVDPEDKSINKGKIVVNLTEAAFFHSAKEAARKYNIPYSTLIAHLHGKIKLVNGMKMCYLADFVYRANDITSYIVELKANELTKAEQVRLAEERAARAEAETQRFKDIWHSVQNTVDEAFTG